jgi:hypothetical protein
MKVKTCGHTWQGACAAEQRTKNTNQPALSGSSSEKNVFVTLLQHTVLNFPVTGKQISL